MNDDFNFLGQINRFFAAEPDVRTGDESVNPRTYATVIAHIDQSDFWFIEIHRAFRAHWTGRLALGALRRTGVEPRFARPAPIVYTVSDKLGADYTIKAWLRRADFAAEMQILDAREASCNEHNQQEADRLARHPVNVAAVAQIQRETDIQAAASSAEADAWLISRMGYSAEEVAAWGKSTRRDRRREARRQMQAERQA